MQTHHHQLSIFSLKLKIFNANCYFTIFTDYRIGATGTFFKEKYGIENDVLYSPLNSPLSLCLLSNNDNARGEKSVQQQLLVLESI